MKKLILSIALFCSVSIANAQTKVFVDGSGNYVAYARLDTAKTNYKETGRYFITRTGEKLPVCITDKGKEFVFVISKKGNKYRKYLTVSK